MNPRKALANLVRHGLRSVGLRAVTRTVHGGPLRIPVAIGELRSLLFDPAYAAFFEEEEVMDLLFQKIGREDVVFDIGAHHGVHSVLFARQAREVFAFEPNPSTFKVLEEMIAVNRVRNVTACQIAIGSEAHTADLWGSGSGSSLRPDRNRSSRHRVTVVTLDGFAQAWSRLPDVLKIDVEGAEHQVLTGGRWCLSHCRLACIELHFEQLQDFGVDHTMVNSLMVDAGFKETARSTPRRQGAEDRSRLHVIFEKATG